VVRCLYAPNWGYTVAVNGSLRGLIVVGRHYTLQLTVLSHAESGATPLLSGVISCLVLIVVSTLVLGANSSFNTYCHRLRSVGFLGGLFPCEGCFPSST
jgi:hypothetical protein